MFGLGQEILLILVLALIVFGPSKFPEMAKALGRALREFKRIEREVRTTVEATLTMEDRGAPTQPESPRITAALMPSPGLDAPAGSRMPLGSNSPDLVTSPVPERPSPGTDAGGGPTDIAGQRRPYWAQRGSRLFHVQGCAWAGRIPEAARLSFDSGAQAADQGLVLCPICGPCSAD